MFEAFSQIFLIAILIGFSLQFVINCFILYGLKWLRIGASFSFRTSVGLAFLLQVVWVGTEIIVIKAANIALILLSSVFISYLLNALVFSGVLWLCSKKIDSVKIKNFGSAVISAIILLVLDQVLLPFFIRELVKY
ncbi:hypothetical protein A3A76_06085 [Candidatus Woesebacteria bacterium RIFCSPLOWO2_01_FULL_39_23]|uniref:Uncharacterized protein n=1 Tax=Candidatus Woesebacteria bacterium RIFCSPHIGHO2_01_FULL_40_22 TaxID=1802499 RepID=A0A1F7YHZ9_9BACT|nr:MAG: hypothetical protein A2141_02780 [Candidatus Woesebacteria bacterium RBG_16_40_11]OGM26971.1 MAG: hypothetical protein A2628_06025 [Candidatus Woesebacteria bacterium RIFCSPHIGHO2_01_FULL_40_22]OGM37378.1 MAG: hypothetical protein A3E41_04430 [Candidatus Woesebacteria bacterium RIFCSPHIGHO2_12_FULL_38_9]OGM63246.1 MAG: hypothetical protein A3A76_06085 [Candidatus Woesebacteria bacterium RIFCSPLOWO2_01_FULL_39_23]